MSKTQEKTPLITPDNAAKHLVGLDGGKAVVAGPVYDLADIGAGFEGLGAESFKTPFLNILQSGSPEVKEEGGKAIPGARQGMAINSVSKQLYDARKTGVRVVPIHTEWKFIEWIPKDSGGGLVEVYEPGDERIKEIRANGPKFGKLLMPLKPGQAEPNQLNSTFTVYSLLLGEEEGFYDRVAISFSSTNIGAYQAWMTMALGMQVKLAHGKVGTPPLFSHVYKLQTQLREKNGQSWYVWVPQFDGAGAKDCELLPDHPLFLAAKDFRVLVTSGGAKVEYAQSEPASNEDPSKF